MVATSPNLKEGCVSYIIKFSKGGLADLLMQASALEPSIYLEVAEKQELPLGSPEMAVISNHRQPSLITGYAMQQTNI